jgi:effector-binding domain-containing protein
MKLTRLPAVPRMACVIHRGGYAGTAHTWQWMLGWLESTGERTGGPLREVYLRFGADATERSSIRSNSPR